MCFDNRFEKYQQTFDAPNVVVRKMSDAVMYLMDDRQMQSAFDYKRKMINMWPRGRTSEAVEGAESDKSLAVTEEQVMKTDRAETHAAKGRDEDEILDVKYRVVGGRQPKWTESEGQVEPDDDGGDAKIAETAPEPAPRRVRKMKACVKDEYSVL